MPLSGCAEGDPQVSYRRPPSCRSCAACHTPAPPASVRRLSVVTRPVSPVSMPVGGIRGGRDWQPARGGRGRGGHPGGTCSCRRVAWGVRGGRGRGGSPCVVVGGRRLYPAPLAIAPPPAALERGAHGRTVPCDPSPQWETDAGPPCGALTASGHCNKIIHYSSLTINNLLSLLFSSPKGRVYLFISPAVCDTSGSRCYKIKTFGGGSTILIRCS